jgi:hypothetical protein
MPVSKSLQEHRDGGEWREGEEVAGEVSPAHSLPPQICAANDLESVPVLSTDGAPVRNPVVPGLQPMLFRHCRNQEGRFFCCCG